MPEPCTVHLIRTAAELEALTPAWVTLWNSDPHATPFQRPEWLLPWWHNFGTADLRAATVYLESSLVALLPLYIYFDAHRNERQLLLIGAGTSDYLDGIFAPACTAQHITQALERLREDSGWDVAHLTQLREQSLLREALEAIREEGKEPYEGEHTSRCTATTMRDLPKKLRADVLYFRNAAIGQGKLEVVTADAGNCSGIFEELVREHTARWQSAGEAGVLADPRVLSWHREAIPQLQAAGLLRLCALTLDGTIIAVLYSLIDPPGRPGRTLYLYLNGHTMNHADLQPGTLLQALAMEHALGEGVATLDMLRGDEAYKQMWRAARVPTFGYAWRPLPRPPRVLAEADLAAAI